MMVNKILKKGVDLGKKVADTQVFEEYLELSYKAKQNLYSFINKKNSYLFSNKIHKEKLISETNKFNRSCQKIDEL